MSREIKSVEISSAAETQLLGDIIFDDILKGKTKHRYVPYKTDYPFNRVCDDRYWGKELKDELGLEVISPLHDEYSLFIPAKCNLYSSNKEGHVIVKAPAPGYTQKLFIGVYLGILEIYGIENGSVIMTKGKPDFEYEIKW